MSRPTISSSLNSCFHAIGTVVLVLSNQVRGPTLPPVSVKWLGRYLVEGDPVPTDADGVFDASSRHVGSLSPDRHTLETNPAPI